MSAFWNTSVIVIDANICLTLVLPLPYSPQVEVKMHNWEKECLRIGVPALWEYEMVSGLRRACVHNILNQESARKALPLLLGLNLEVVPARPERHLRALEWAERLGHARASDAQYLVLAHELDAVLWTGDQRLADWTSQMDITWVRWIGED